MSTNTKKKRGAVAAVVIIVLCLAALGALGYVIWQQFHPAVPETAAGYVASAESTAPVYDENGEEIENYWYAGYICNAQEEPLYTLVVLEETAGETHVPQAFRKIGEALVDFN